MIILNSITELAPDLKKRILKACINTVNIQAFLARKNALDNIEKKFTLRNTFTKRSITVEQCPRNAASLGEIKSTVGATERAEYMARQEEGGERTPKNGDRLAIPTTEARGGSNQNLVQTEMRVSRVLRRKINRRKAKITRTRKSAVVAAAYVAHETGRLMSFDRALFRVDSFEKNGDSVRFEKTMIYNFKHRKTETKPEPWLSPATEKPADDGQKIFNSQMAKLENSRIAK